MSQWTPGALFACSVQVTDRAVSWQWLLAPADWIQDCFGYCPWYFFSSLSTWKNLENVITGVTSLQPLCWALLSHRVTARPDGSRCPWLCCLSQGLPSAPFALPGLWYSLWHTALLPLLLTCTVLSPKQSKGTVMMTLELLCSSVSIFTLSWSLVR